MIIISLQNTAFVLLNNLSLRLIFANLIHSLLSKQVGKELHIR